MISASFGFHETCSGASCHFCNVPAGPRCQTCRGDDAVRLKSGVTLCEWCHDEGAEAYLVATVKLFGYAVPPGMCLDCGREPRMAIAFDEEKEEYILSSYCHDCDFDRFHGLR